MKVPRRWIGVWLCAVLAASCTASGGSDSPDGSLDLDRSVLGDAAMFFPDDMLTAPATNLRLRPTRERNATVSKVIDWRGGRISATGSDGTVYALAIPKRAVAMPTEINLTPLADVEGLPFDQPPENRLGVEFGPEGLELATPAVLTVEPPRPVAPGALTMGFHEGGRFTGAIASDEQGSRITVAIDHFSGYVMVWPLTEPDWRRLARIRLDSIENEFLSNIAAMLARDRQKQAIFGIETPNLLDVAAEVLPAFEEKVLEARVRAAASGCGETKQAIQAYVRYWQVTQLLGVADKDSPYARPIPESLFELEMKLCWEEAFIRCRVTGDFKSLVNYLLVNYRQYSIWTGEEPTAEMKSKAQGYLKRCGHWRVTATSLVDSVKPYYPWHTTTYGLRTEFELAWEPTDELFDLGLVGSRIEGTGKVEIDMMKATFDPPGTPCSVELEPGVVKYEPHAKLTEVTFDQPKQEWVPGVREIGSELEVGGYWRETGPPTPRALSLALFVPVVASVYRPHCTIAIHESGVAVYDMSFVDLYEWLIPGSKGAARLQAAMIRPGDPDFIEWRESGLSPFGLRFSKGWKVCGRPRPYRACASPPFTADQSLTDAGARGDDTYDIKLDVKIEHEPR